MLVHRQGIQTPFGNWAYVYNRKIEQNKQKYNYSSREQQIVEKGDNQIQV